MKIKKTNFSLKINLDGDGKISWEELGYVMKLLGHKVSENQLKDIMQMIDENGLNFFLFKSIFFSFFS